MITEKEARTGGQRKEHGLVIVVVPLLAVMLLVLTAPGVKARVAMDPCSGQNLFPLTVINSTFGPEPGHKPVPGQIYTLWDMEELAPGNFSWVYWVDGDGVVRETPPQNPTVTVLTENILDTTRSGSWRVGDWVHGVSGVVWSTSMLDALGARINGPLVPTVTISIYDQMQGVGSDVHFRMAFYGAFRLVCAKASQAQYVERQPGDCDPCMEMPSNVKCLRGYFVRWVRSPAPTFCSDTGP